MVIIAADLSIIGSFRVEIRIISIVTDASGKQNTFYNFTSN